MIRIIKNAMIGLAMPLAMVGAAGLLATPLAAQEAAPGGMNAASEAETAFERDRRAILAMAGDYRVRFEFTETVAFEEGYTPKEPYISGGYEIVRVIEDRGDFISLQHILVVGGDQKFPIKHWRQDWRWEPEQVLTFVGGNAWEMQDVPEAERAGRWSQTVYQVDDAPRYGAMGDFSHENGVSEWTGEAEWRPLPRRDMTKRDDYHAVIAVNRHAITPDGWVHEQDNSKLALDGTPRVLVREIGVNTYVRDDSFPTEIGDEYWSKTAGYWADVRQIWDAMEADGQPFAIIQKGETERLYMALLGLAGEVADGSKGTEAAVAEAREVIARETTTELAPLQQRLRPAKDATEY